MSMRSTTTLRRAGFCAAFVGALLMANGAAAQTSFATPDAAAAALKAATARFDQAALGALFGPEFDRIKSADTAQLQGNVERTHKALGELVVIKPEGADRATLVIGFEAWPFPVPLAKQASGQWRFDAAAGAEEIVNRRIGENELKAIATLRFYVAAQREYASRPRGEGPLRAFAQRIRSSPGKKDGLYWPAGPGEEQSPFGPLVPDASRREPGAPYYGYIYRILTAQGPEAPGGAYSYVINGNMVAGFAMIAYPAEYGNTGIMTFIVNHYGDVYEKDLGRDTARLASGLRAYNPRAGWMPADDDPR
ncbi:MAG: DUF2950 domain-containing protein [Alphaproteobacteria bacterium]|nr:DUF2950 domain-containing protein [Alphaproteobacteria bacterium]